MKKKICFIIIFVFFSLLAYGAVPTQEREALIALYHSTNGDNWTNNSGWKNPPLHSDGFAIPGTEDTWFGITVTNDQVTQIGMGYNNLNGNMPPELGNLSQLEYLFLADNYTLSGSIPNELGKLSNLILFQASVNQLTGSIPPELGNLKKLKGLRLYANRLSGSLPPELGNLTELDDFMMGMNLFSGNIPPELGNLGKVRYFDLYDNRLSGRIPAELGNLASVEYLGLYWNRLTGKIPVTLVNLRSAAIKIDYNGLYTDNDTLRAFLDSNTPGWENTQTIAPSDVTVTPLSQTSARISWTPISYTWDTGGYRIFYRLSSKNSRTYSGMTADKLASSYEVTGLAPGDHYCFAVQTRTNPHYINPNTVDSEFSSEVCTAVGSIGPFGWFDTPKHGAIARGSIPVTGWALDDVGVVYVKIYREKSAEAGEKTNGALVFIGDADFVENARPDVEEAFPGYPNNHRAGWGYMMLTNFLPNHGNGTFKIHAVAADVEGNQTTLGIKTIICDNANAVKPFGTIDTPGQGGNASGKQFVNFGWALTPLPNTIPTDGSTITVWVNGVPLGHPVYNRYRADIAALFPDYNNSNGAVGYYFLDTTQYKNGMHTIQWTVTDDAGNRDGIGSRYFTVQNPAASQAAAFDIQPSRFKVDLSQIPVGVPGPILLERGYNRHTDPQTVYPDEKDAITIEIEELERFEIRLTPGNTSSCRYTGYLVVGKSLKALPIGSTFDAVRGVFSWQPGPGFIKNYRLVFIEETADGYITRKNILITITPKSSIQKD
ncbi:fibronectin type III domain-containing protein [Acidobacteriota bacterium]